MCQIIIITFTCYINTCQESGALCNLDYYNKNCVVWCIFKHCLSHKLAWLVCIMSYLLVFFNWRASGSAGVGSSLRN